MINFHFFINRGEKRLFGMPWCFMYFMKVSQKSSLGLVIA